MHFIEMIEKAQAKNNSFLCVGLDPDRSKFPAEFRDDHVPLLSFNKAIIDATADLVCCYKPQIAYYSAIGAEEQLKQSIDYIHKTYPGIPVILDAKRNDIGSTAEMYVREAFERYSADAVTVNPFMGSDTLEPFLKNREKGVIVLCKTSNAGSSDFQNKLIDGQPLYQLIAQKAHNEWNYNGNVCLVVGATYPEEMRAIRAIAPTIPFLVPGIGAQGGDVVSVINSGCTSNGGGLIINSSRAIIHAGSGSDFAQKARDAAVNQQQAINDARKGCLQSTENNLR
jgi:orotidine-5'-phosphate decarboxylase